MSQIERFREQIDACRPGSDDLALPAMGELAQAAERDRALAEELGRAQQFDRAVAAAMHDVTLPHELLERLLDTVNSAAAADEASLAVASKESVRPSAHRARRRWLAMAGSISLVALVMLLAAYVWLRPRPVIGRNDLNGAIGAWWDAARETKRWLPVTGHPAPGSFPLDSAVKAQPMQWQTLPPIRGWQFATITAIDLSQPGKAPAMLFVVRSSARYDVPAGPSVSRSLNLSRGLAATAWQKPGSNLLFVLVVEEDRVQHLADFLQRPFEA